MLTHLGTPSSALTGSVGIYNIAFGLFHIIFWRLFEWPTSIRASGAVNAAITQTLNVMLTYCFLLYGGWLIWTSAAEVVPHPLLLSAGGGFWLLRTAVQPVLFQMRSRRSVVLTAVFVLGTGLHFVAAWFSR